MQYPLRFVREYDSIAGIRDMTPLSGLEFIFFGEGSRDRFCPYIGRFDIRTQVGVPMCSYPSDKHYFELLQFLASQVHPVVLYSDMQNIFRHSGRIGQEDFHPDSGFIEFLKLRSRAYGEYGDVFFSAAVQVYYGMIAENCHRGARLGARLKLNGIFELLFGTGSIVYAADCNRGKNYVQIHAECCARGIFNPED